MDYLKIKGARTHNLKNISIDIPKNKLIVIQVYRAPANHRWHLTHYMQRGKDGM